MFSLETKAPTHCPVKFGGGDELESSPPPQLIMETITNKRRATKPKIFKNEKLNCLPKKEPGRKYYSAVRLKNDSLGIFFTGTSP